MRPTREEVAAAAGRTIEDVIAPGLTVLFVGINPSLYSAAVGRHFARPGNRFWPALHAAGFVPRLLSAADQWELPTVGLGITNLVARATARADELSDQEIRAGARTLAAKVERFAPSYVAFLGVTAYRIASGDRRARVGPAGGFGGSVAWVLPNPSGLNAHYRLSDLAAVYRELRMAARPAR